MITPDLPLARAITTAILDRIERDRAISSESITEAVLGKLLYANALAGEAPAGDGDITKLARDLVRAMQRDTKIKDISEDTALAYSALARAVNR
jgi:hypothetical protein